MLYHFPWWAQNKWYFGGTGLVAPAYINHLQKESSEVPTSHWAYQFSWTKPHSTDISQMTIFLVQSLSNLRWGCTIIAARNQDFSHFRSNTFFCKALVLCDFCNMNKLLFFLWTEITSKISLISSTWTNYGLQATFDTLSFLL